MSVEPVRVGIAGLGRSGWAIHAQLLERLHSQYQIVATVDSDTERCTEAVKRFNCRAYTKYDDLLSDLNVELIIVSLPTHLHANATISALQADKHVVCEKPMATSLVDADLMVKTAADSGRILTVFHQRRYSPDFIKIKEIINSGLLGRIIEIRIAETQFSRRWDWQTLQKFGGGTLNNNGPHYLDLAMQLIGETDPQITCHLDRTLTLGDADDHVKIVLRGSGSPIVDIEFSSCVVYTPALWNIIGTCGGLIGTNRQLRWRWISPTELPHRMVDTRPTHDRSYNREELVWSEDSWQMTGSNDDYYVGFYSDLFASIRHGAPIKITPTSVQRVVWLQEQCHLLSPLPQAIS